jgi:hypothetical protein
MRAIAILIWSVSILVTQLTGARSGDLPGREVWLPENEVQDRFYSYLIGLIQADTCGTLYAADLENVLRDYHGRTSIPFETIKDIRRQCPTTGGGTNPDSRDVSISFWKNLSTPVPYSILGYHPGSVRASSAVRFLEWDIPQATLRWNRQEAVELSHIYVLGGLLDDTRIVVVALFKYKGEWHGLAAGYDPSGEGRSGIFNFSQNRILFPTPRELRMLGPYFRHFVVRVKKVDVPLPPEDRWLPAG